MEQVDVIAVVGSCVPERRAYARRLATTGERMLVPAQRLALSADPARDGAALARWAAQPAGALIELPGHTEMTEMIGTLARPDGDTQLTAVVCVADAAHLREDLCRDDYVFRPPHPWQRAEDLGHTASAMLTVSQLEFASMIVLVNWETLSTSELSTTMALVSHLGPQARLRLDHDRIEAPHPGVPYSIGQERPGWIALLNGDHDPHMTDPRVSAFRYENVRPLHPGRLEHLLDQRIEPGEFGAVIRSAGFCRFATRSHVVARWDHVGRMISFDPLGVDDVAGGEETLAIGEDLAVIGVDLDRTALIAALDEATLSDAELAAGPAAWGGFSDPFPVWPTAADRAD